MNDLWFSYSPEEENFLLQNIFNNIKKVLSVIFSEKMSHIREKEWAIGGGRSSMFTNHEHSDLDILLKYPTVQNFPS